MSIHVRVEDSFSVGLRGVVLIELEVLDIVLDAAVQSLIVSSSKGSGVRLILFTAQVSAPPRQATSARYPNATDRSEVYRPRVESRECPRERVLLQERLIHLARGRRLN